MFKPEDKNLTECVSNGNGSKYESEIVDTEYMEELNALKDFQEGEWVYEDDE